MSRETLLLRIPGINQLLPVDVLNSEDKSEFDVVLRVMGGKIRRTQAEKILMRDAKPKQGSAHGRIRYTSQGDAAKEIYRPMLINKLRAALAILQEQEELANR